jgi:signal transduction histidine kinase
MTQRRRDVLGGFALRGGQVQSGAANCWVTVAHGPGQIGV